MTTTVLVVLCIYGGLQLCRYALDYLNMNHLRRHRDQVPGDFEGVVDAALLKRAEEYSIEKTRFGVVVSLLSSAGVVIFLFTGIIDVYSSWIGSLGLGFISSGWLFFFLLYLAAEVLSLPFSLYFIFRLENRYGFTTMTFRLWVADFMKKLLVEIVLFSLAALAGLWLVSYTPHFWWFWVWCFFLTLTLFVTYISPYVIEPLFNKFTPLEDVHLREQVVRLAARADINVSKVLKMDESKRSTHTNAYFTGLGRTKRIILFDTLLATMDQQEVLSVLAHEIGHWKRRHVLKGLALVESFSLILLFVAHRVLQGDLLPSLFGLHHDSFFVRATIVGFLAGMVGFVAKPAINGLSRRFEREADRFSCNLEGEAGAMVRALVKLSKENLSNLHPHPLYAAFHYSHPPVLERIREIREYCERRESSKMEKRAL